MRQRRELTDQPFLVVDDEVLSLDVVRRMLSILGATVVTAGDGVAAIDALKSTAGVFGCVITDFDMPKMNGLELLKTIRMGTAGIPREMPVIMLTGHADTDLVGTALALDANGFIVKPVSQRVLVDRLSRVLNEPPLIRPALAYKVVQALTLADIRKKPPTDAPPPPRSSATDARPAGSVMSTPMPKGIGIPSGEALRSLDATVENTVLSRDIHTRNGVQLLAAGEVLTPRLVERLRDLKKADEPQLEVWVRAQ